MYAGAGPTILIDLHFEFWYANSMAKLSDTRHCIHCKCDTEHVRYGDTAGSRWKCSECRRQAWMGEWVDGLCPKHGPTMVRQKYNRRGNRIGFVRQCCRNERDKAKQKKKKEDLVSIFGGKCSICGYDRYSGALEFHHRDPSRKESTTPHKLGCNMVLREAAKCVLLCANCHREVHHGLHPGYMEESPLVWRGGISNTDGSYHRKCIVLDGRDRT